jgi:hypothetical protein
MSTPAGSGPVAQDDRDAAVAKMTEVFTSWGIPADDAAKGAEAAVDEAIKRRGSA